MQLWIARDGGGALYLYESKPQWSEVGEYWYTGGRFCLIDDVALDIAPGECVEFVQKEQDDAER